MKAKAAERREAWKKSKNGSIFPAKRRSVKKMIWDLFVLQLTATNSTTATTVHPCST